MRFSVRTAFSVVGILACSRLIASEGKFQDGDSCGVESSDFVNDFFAGEYRVAGTSGCNLGLADDVTRLGDDLTQTGCFCAPDFDDQDSLSAWKWQCNNSVNFGPVAPKVCPATIPIGTKNGVDIELSRRAAENTLACDSSIHPTGRPGDEVCPYSDCDQGGDFSAICGCVDLARTGMGQGEQWFCLQSTCSCTKKEEDAGFYTGLDDPKSSASGMSMSIMGMAIAVPLLFVATSSILVAM
eukprot:scaffold37399_cov54-Attheya_sp.AAC.2